MNKLIICAIIGFCVLGAVYVFYREGSLPVNSDKSQPRIFVISRGEALNSIINNLSSEGFIRNRVIFYFIVKQKGIERRIQAGDFRLSQSMNAYEVADQLTHGTLDEWITIPEGLRKEEVAEILARKEGISEIEFNELVKEGSLFPDTYLVPKGASLEQIVSILTKTMDARYATVSEKAAARGLSRHEVITLASLVEREAAGDDDRQEIANIIMKRYKEGWPLQIDATIQYAIGYRPAEKSWWTKRLTQDDYKSVESSYNTYLHTGLPPGPICNPGLDAIKAVVDADEGTKYWYYSHDEKGVAHFAVSLGTHEENLEK